MLNFHVAIIGGGVIGSAIARELSKYKIKIIVFEKGCDVASGASKANSGVVHSGINSADFSLKARFCVEGNKMFQHLADELNFPLKWVGKFVIAKNDEEVKKLELLKNVGIKNGVTGLEIIKGKELKKKEPYVSCISALWVPTAGITLPYQFTIILAENSIENGVKFLLETNVKNIKKQKNDFLIETNKGNFQSDIVINAAGLNCREIISMIEEPDFNIYPCRGEYLVLDKNYSYLINSMIYPIPVEKHGILGIHITPTIEGNILLGPSAEFIDNPNDKKTTKEKMNIIISEAKDIIPQISKKAVINAYAGIRCKLSHPRSNKPSDYIIEESKKTPGLINLLGIESPGLTAAPAIARQVSNIVSRSIELKQKNKFKIKSYKIKRFSEMTSEEQSALIKKDNKWGRIICRCEQITEAEVIKALSNPLESQTLSAVKFRCRAGMGRCQGGFCTQHIVRIMEKNFNIDIKNMKLKSPDSKLFYSKLRGKIDD